MKREMEFNIDVDGKKVITVVDYGTDLHKLNIPWHGVCSNSPYDCSGKWCASSATITRIYRQGIVVIVQNWYLDI